MITETPQVTEAGKNRAIIAHMTVIGWIIALIQNNGNGEKDEFASYYIRQMLGLLILAVGFQIIGFMIMIVPFIGMIVYPLIGLGILVLWVMSLIGAINGQKSPTPLLGNLFQDWFRSL